MCLQVHGKSEAANTSDQQTDYQEIYQAPLSRISQVASQKFKKV